VAKVVGLDAILAAGTAAAGLIAVHAVPAGWLGPTGELIRPWYPLAAVAVSARMLALPMADLLSLGAGTDRVIRYRLATAALDWAATLAGALTFGIAGALAAKAAALVVAAGLWARATVTACRRAGVVSEGS
jgi:hypothetical protein